MVASIHIADVGVRSALSLLRSCPSPASAPGLRHANSVLAVPLHRSPFRVPGLRRVGLVAFWDDDPALDRFLEAHPVAAALADGWHVRLEPLRVVGDWPGLPSGVSPAADTSHEGPVVGLTIARVRPSRVVRFVRMSAAAQAEALDSTGFTWAVDLTHPLHALIGTCSLWRDARALTRYTHGRDGTAHRAALAEDRRRPFFSLGAFARFRPTSSRGKLDGGNPLPESWMEPELAYQSAAKPATSRARSSGASSGTKV